MLAGLLKPHRNSSGSKRRGLTVSLAAQGGGEGTLRVERSADLVS